MKIKRIFLATALSLGILNSNAQKFSLQQALDHALVNNYKAKNAQLDINIAKKRIAETRGMGLPQINGSVAYQNKIDLEFDFPDVIPPGQEFMQIFAADNVTQAKLEATQLIFDGTYFVGLKAAKTYKAFAENQKEKTNAEVKSDVAKAYYLALVADENISILEGTTKTMNQSIEETKQLVKQGFIEQTELDQLELTANDMESTLSNAKLQRDVAYKMLKLNMGLEVNDTVTLSDSLSGILDKISIESLIAQTFDAGSNPELRVMETQRDLLRLDVKKWKVNRYPSLVGFYNYTNTAYQLEFDFYRDATWLDAQTAGVSLNVPIWSSGRSGAKIKQAKYELEKMENTLKFATDAKNVQFKNAQNALINNQSNYSSAKKSMELAESILSKTEKKRKAGMASSFELTQMKTQLLQAQGKYISSLFELLNSKAELDKLQNKL